MNMSRTTKIMGFSVPPTVVREVETQVGCVTTRSEGNWARSGSGVL